jgi:hypothetical protein
VSRPIAGGLLDVTVERNENYETVGLAAPLIDSAPSPLRKWLRAFPRVRARDIPEGELFTAGLVAGLGAEFAKILVLHPIDTVRARLQARAGLTRGAFRAFDTDGSGGVSQSEMAASLSKLQPEVSEEVIRQIVEEADTDDSGEIEYGEFAALLRRQQQQQQQQGGESSSPLTEAVAATGNDLTRRRASMQLLDQPYAGILPALATAAPQAGLYAATRDVARQELAALVAASKIGNDAAALVAVIAASSFYWIARAPSEVYKLQQQASALAPGRSDAEGGDATAGSTNRIALDPSRLADMARLGVRAYPICLMANLPEIVTRLLTYKSLKAFLLSFDGGALAQEGGVLALTDEVVAAVICACAVAALATPLDVLRTRTLQLILSDDESLRSGDDEAVAAASADPTGIRRAAAQLSDATRRDGAAILFAGAVPRVLWNGCVVGATTPLRSVGFYWARDGVILQLFDSVSSAAGSTISIG